MMKRLLVAGLASLLLLTACGDKKETVTKTVAQQMQGTDIGYYCTMRMDEHDGPKGQIHITGQDKPLWVSSIDQVFAFRYSPEEPKNVSAIYVNDMGAVNDWKAPGANDVWIDAETAYYVVGSDFIGGMGMVDILPFSDEKKAQTFALSRGGKVMRFNEVPEESAFNTGSMTFGPDGTMDHSAHQGHGASAEHGTSTMDHSAHSTPSNAAPGEHAEHGTSTMDHSAHSTPSNAAPSEHAEPSAESSSHHGVEHGAAPAGSAH